MRTFTQLCLRLTHSMPVGSGIRVYRVLYVLAACVQDGKHSHSFPINFLLKHMGQEPNTYWNMMHFIVARGVLIVSNDIPYHIRGLYCIGGSHHCLRGGLHHIRGVPPILRGVTCHGGVGQRTSSLLKRTSSLLKRTSSSVTGNVCQE